MKCKINGSVGLVGDAMVFESRFHRNQTKVGKIVRVRGSEIIFQIFKTKEKFVKNFLKRNKVNNIQILPNHNHPLTTIFK